jgi:hypothetical protein
MSFMVSVNYAECRYAECCGTGQRLELDLNGHNYVRPSREYFSSTWGSTLKLYGHCQVCITLSQFHYPVGYLLIWQPCFI